MTPVSCRCRDLASWRAKAIHVGGVDAQAVHAGIDFQMERNFALAGGGRGAVELRQLFAAVNDGGEIVFEQALFFAGDEAGEDQDGFAYARFAQARCLLPCR